MRLLLATFAALGPAAPLAAQDAFAGDIRVERATAYETAPTAMAGSGYMTITNLGDTADRLLEVRAGFAHVSLHQTMEADGVARMLPAGAVEIAPGETLALEPGGLHVMFMGLGGDPFEIGEEVPATLVFERAGVVEIVFDVVARDGAAARRDAGD